MREGASSFGNEPHHVSREEELAALRASRNPDITLPPMRPEHKASNVPETPADDRDEWQMAYPRDHLLATIPTVRVETLDQATSRKVLAAEEKTEAWERPATKGAMESLAFPRRKVTADPEATRKMNKQSVEKKESRVTPVLDLRGLSWVVVWFAQASCLAAEVLERCTRCIWSAGSQGGERWIEPLGAGKCVC